MTDELKKAPEITLLKSEMEAAAARVAERAGNLTVDGVAGITREVFGGIIGDDLTQWRNRNLVTKLAKSKEHFDRLGIPIENAKALPKGDLYAIFDGMSKQDDPQLSEMWSALLTNAMRPDRDAPLDPALPKVLEQLSGVDALILNFYREATILRLETALDKKQERKVLDREDLSEHRLFIKMEGEKILTLFGNEVVTSSLGNLIRLGLLYVEVDHDSSASLVRVEILRNDTARVDVSELRDELAAIYYKLNLANDAVEEHKIIHHYLHDAQPYYFLPYDLTRLSKRLLKACTIKSE